MSRQRDDLLIEALRKAEGSQTSITDEELRRAWESDRARFAQPETLRIAQIHLAADRESIRSRLTAERAAEAWTAFIAKSERERGLVLLE